jgi:hypothetical protein
MSDSAALRALYYALGIESPGEETTSKDGVET